MKRCTKHCTKTMSKAGKQKSWLDWAGPGLIALALALVGAVLWFGTSFTSVPTPSIPSPLAVATFGPTLPPTPSPRPTRPPTPAIGYAPVGPTLPQSASIDALPPSRSPATATPRSETESPTPLSAGPGAVVTPVGVSPTVPPTLVLPPTLALPTVPPTEALASPVPPTPMPTPARPGSSSASAVPSGPGVGPTATAPTTTAPVKPTTVAALRLSAERYGLIVTGLADQTEPNAAAVIRRMLAVSGGRWWYSYLPQHPAIGGSQPAHQVYMVRLFGKATVAENLKYWLDFIRQTGHFDQPTYWLIGNEPNVVGQDNTPPGLYAEALYEFSKAVRVADPRAVLIGPNVLNWDQTCQACPGFTAGLTWTEAMRTAYRSRYGSEPPLNAWSIHTYSLDWNHLPLINQSQDALQIQNLRSYLDKVAELRNRPIWLSEFGVVWGYDGIQWQAGADGNYTAQPRGQFRKDLIEQYLTASLDWLEVNADRLKIERWFVFTSLGEPEGFSPTTFAGLALFDNPSPTLNLTNFGRLYAERLKKAAQSP